jgi:thiol-disulfide isomerase/thioredoxin
MTNINLNTILHVLLGILLLMVLLQYVFSSTYYKNYLAEQKHEADKQQQWLDTLFRNQEETISKINNAIEEGFANDFPSYLNKTDQIKLELYYKPSCPYCKNFMPVWYQIVNNLPNGVTYEEINVEENSIKPSQNNISTVPTLLLMVNNEQKTYMGDRSYKNIEDFLKLNGVNLIERNFEYFDDNGYSSLQDSLANPGMRSEQEPTPVLNKRCPAVTFDKQIDLEGDRHLFQIFNADGQYGYAEGGFNEGKLLNPFQAAYSTIDTYLSSLPDGNKYIDECTNLYAKDIINFGLCDSEQLDQIQNYGKEIAKGSKIARARNTNYSSNDMIIKSIKNVCNL